MNVVISGCAERCSDPADVGSCVVEPLQMGQGEVDGEILQRESGQNVRRCQDFVPFFAEQEEERVQEVVLVRFRVRYLPLVPQEVDDVPLGVRSSLLQDLLGRVLDHQDQG